MSSNILFVIANILNICQNIHCNMKFKVNGNLGHIPYCYYCIGSDFIFIYNRKIKVNENMGHPFYTIAIALSGIKKQY